jgi:superfamily II DNA helicase RecQ
MADSQRVLEQIYRMETLYQSEAQEQAIHHMVEEAGQVLAILQTSEGKSLLYLLPCQLLGATTTVVILPLVVLQAEIQRRCLAAGIQAYVWDSSSDLDHAINSPLILVGVE